MKSTTNANWSYELTTAPGFLYLWQQIERLR